MVEIKGTIKNAQVVQHATGSYVVIGNVYNHPEYADGTLIRTSKVQQVDFKRGLATTLNSTYVVQL